jgi:hypothetical protein
MAGKLFQFYPLITRPLWFGVPATCLSALWAEVNPTLTVFLPASMVDTAARYSNPRALRLSWQASAHAPGCTFDREQGRTGGLHPDA